ncbi:PadR family transcriptional regulator [Streptomyces sp. NPDC094032]|uniref:PadR family transcriptional regulator n=1 Tax=Streptomyces sp. NPDC094032 TaxID=3155308 RepID=UPI00332FB7A6
MSLRHALLGLLAEGPASGYDLLGTFRTSLSHVWPATQSQIYTELTKLDAAGLTRVADEGPRGRKTYEITEAGRDELRHWLLEVPPSGYRRNDNLLRVFLLGAVDTAEAGAYLRREAEAARRKHAELQAVERDTDWDEGGLSVYGRLTLEWGKRITLLQAEWAAWAEQEIEAARTSG